MVEREATARWVRRIGSVAALTILAFLLGELSAREGRSETPAADPALSAQPDKRYGPNPNYRLTPQINRIIRLAQRDKKEDDKGRVTGGGGTQLKTAPVQKKTAPVQKKTAPVKKSTTPTTRKKETAPVKKRETAPVKKKEMAPVKKKAAPVKKDTAPAAKKKIAPVKKDTAPAIKKETAPAPKKEMAPVTKEVAPAETTVPGAPPSDEQLQENKEYCAQNPNDPSCSKEAPPPGEPEPVEAEQPPPATEKICAANPKYPGCDKLKPPPDLGGAKGEEEGGVGSICEQNPQLPQCQAQETTQPEVPGGRPEEKEDAVEAPPGPPGEDAPPGFPPPGGPIPPGPPPSPPSPPPSDEGEAAPPPPGPTIQTVTECQEGQVLFAGQCVWAGACPEGQVETAPAQEGLQCDESCPVGMASIAGQCYSESFCSSIGAVLHEGQCLTECPEGQVLFAGQCVWAGACPEGQVETAPAQEGLQCDESCPAGMASIAGQCYSESFCSSIGAVLHEGQCLTQCPEDTEEVDNSCQPTVVECPAGQGRLSDGTCGTCPVGAGIREDGTCGACPAGTAEDPAVGSDGTCLAECPAGTIREGDQCVAGCPEGQARFAGQCVPQGNCPEGQLSSESEDGFECIARDECLEDGYMVERAGACISGGACQASGGVVVDRVCLEQCPEGQEQVGANCQAACPAGTNRIEDECVGICSPGMIWEDGVCTALQCPEGEEVVGSTCQEACPAGTVRHELQCVAECPEGSERVLDACEPVAPEPPEPCPSADQLRVDGVCTGLGDVPYEDLIQYCVGSSGPSGTVVVPENLQGATPQETCENLVDALCEQGEIQGVPVSEAPACTERPCGEGQENVGGQCLTACAEGAERAADGQCLAACPEGAERGADGLCPGECAAGQIMGANGQCQSCAAGLEASNGQCVAPCLNNAERDANGQCPASCPEGQVISANGTQCVDRCIYQDAPIAYDGRCIPECPEGQMLYQGQCQQQAACPEGTYQRTGTVNSICVDECPEGQYATNTAAGLQCRSQCGGHAEVVEGECVPPCPMGETRGPDGQCSNPCPGEQVFVGGQCRNRCAAGDMMFNGFCAAEGQCPYVVDGFCVPGPTTREDAVELCVSSGFLAAESPDEAACEAAVDADCAAQTDPGSPGAIRSYCIVPEETAVAEGPTDGEAPPEGGEAPTPPDETAPPPEDGEAPPPENQTPPPEDDDAPPPEETPPSEDGEVPPPPEDDGEVGAICEQNPQLPQCQNHEAPPPDETAPPPDETAPPPEDDEAPPPEEGEAPPPENGEGPPPPEDADDFGSICEQNPQFAQCQEQDADEGAPPHDDQQPPPPDDIAPPPSPPPASGKPPAAPPADASPPAGEAAESSVGKPIAVVIAIDDYDDDALTGFPQAIDNAAHIVRFLKDDLGFDDYHIITGRNAEGSDFKEIFGKPGAIDSELRELIKKTKASEVIVYYAGRADALDDGEVLLLPSDTVPDKPETGVKLSGLYNNLYAMGIPKLRVYLDPSFVKGDDVAELQAGPKIGLLGLFTPLDWVAISAASDNTPMVRDSEKARSLFTESLVAGLRGIADTTGEGDGDGTVSAQELYDFMRGQAEAAAKRGDKVPMPSFYGPSGEALRAY